MVTMGGRGVLNNDPSITMSMAARHQRIATSLRPTAGSRAHLGASQYIEPYSLTNEHITPLQRLVDNIYYFPVSWRKFIVEFCRIQKPIKGNAHLTSMLLDLVDTTLSGDTIGRSQ